nr:wssv106 [White spot syndrome virus]
MNIADVLSIVHTDGLFSSVHFRKDTMEYGVAKSKSKIIPKTIKIKKGGDTFHSEEDIEVPVKFTAITSEELNRECNTKGMNSLRAHKKRKSNSSTTTTSTTSTSTTANTPKKTKKSASAASDPFAKLTLDYVDSTSFVFYNISKEMVQRILAQERVKTLKAVKNEEKMEIVEGEEAQETYRGIVKIKTNAKAYNLANKTSGVLFPADKVCLKHTLEDLGDVLDFDVVREDNVNKTVASTTTTSSENKASGGDDEETPMEFETDGEKLLHELLNE